MRSDLLVLLLLVAIETIAECSSFNSHIGSYHAETIESSLVDFNRLNDVEITMKKDSGKSADNRSELIDSTYYCSYADRITTRFYFSRKYTSLLVRDKGRNIDLDYHPNTTLNMGVGATYRSFTLNLAYGFPFLNQNQAKGDTRYLDLQAHFYGRKSTIDLFGEFYNGFYLSPKGKGTRPDAYYVRPDMKLREVGVSYQYVFNHRRFSYRASFLQNEWQYRSSGTFLLGGEMFAGRAFADSSIYPTAISPIDVPQATEVRFVELGPSAGYAYTLVMARNFFITGSLALGFDYNFTEYISNGQYTTVYGFSPNTVFRLFAGYNSRRHAISFTFTNSTVSLPGGEENYVSMNTGNIRLNFVRRFDGGPATRKVLNRLDRWLK